jgi:hypothetical protein
MVDRHSVRFLSLAGLLAAMSLGLAACEREGPVERAGEEVDEAVGTLREGEESTANKVDDTVDEVREGAAEATDEARE